MPHCRKIKETVTFLPEGRVADGIHFAGAEREQNSESVSLTLCFFDPTAGGT
jgi:hypothetical protein